MAEERKKDKPMAADWLQEYTPCEQGGCFSDECCCTDWHFFILSAIIGVFTSLIIAMWLGSVSPCDSGDYLLGPAESIGFGGFIYRGACKAEVALQGDDVALASCSPVVPFPGPTGLLSMQAMVRFTAASQKTIYFFRRIVRCMHTDDPFRLVLLDGSKGYSKCIRSPLSYEELYASRNGPTPWACAEVGRYLDVAN